jgi:hypothetical protein
MGSVMGLAFADVKEKAEILVKRSTENGDCAGMIFKLIEKEKRLGILELNGENNKKITKD